jgi:dimethylhistidine N-methyltransferase
MLDIVRSRALQQEAFRAEALAGLSNQQKSVPPRWLYDRRGSELFEEITRLEEYYPTRTETAILMRDADEMGALCGEDVVLLEYGAGAGLKSEILLDGLTPRMYVPIDIAEEFLDQTVARIRHQYPWLAVRPVVADFTSRFDLPLDVAEDRRVAFFPGSTIGNLDRREAAALLRRMRRNVGADGKAIVGVDLRKPIETLIPAYDDAKGVTAEFNLNLLARLNRELDANFQLDRFAHEARWNEEESAIEMHLVSLRTQLVTVAGRRFAFEAGETIHTESSRKYEPAGFTDVAQRCGWRTAKIWTDPAALLAFFGLEAAPL